MKTKVSYSLITDPDPQKFTNSVNLALADGWVPVGGVATTREPGNQSQATAPKIHYSQAMIRRGVNGIDLSV